MLNLWYYSWRLRGGDVDIARKVAIVIILFALTGGALLWSARPPVPVLAEQAQAGLATPRVYVTSLPPTAKAAAQPTAAPQEIKQVEVAPQKPVADSL